MLCAYSTGKFRCSDCRDWCAQLLHYLYLLIMMRVSGFIGRKVREGGHRTHVKGQVFLKTETIRMFSKDLLDETSLNVCVLCSTWRGLPK